MKRSILMAKLWSMALVVALVAVGVVNTQASPFANLASALKVTSDDTGIIEQVHVCNRVCERGPVEEWGGAERWHRHVGKACRPISCKS
jgi:hypothetical protein